jgi:hypothetical protein
MGELAEYDALPSTRIGVLLKQRLALVVGANQREHLLRRFALGQHSLGGPAAPTSPAPVIGDDPCAAQRPRHRPPAPPPLRVPKRAGGSLSDEWAGGRLRGRGHHPKADTTAPRECRSMVGQQSRRSTVSGKGLGHNHRLY